MPIAVRILAMGEKALRDDKMQIVLGACHRNIEKAAFLLDFGRRAGGKIGRDAAIDDVEHKDRLPFLALGRMNRRKDQIILVKKWYACLIARCLRRIEAELCQEPLARGIAAGEQSVYPSAPRPAPCAQKADLRLAAIGKMAL